MKVRVGIDPGDVVIVKVWDIATAVDLVLHEQLTDRFGVSVNHSELDRFIRELIKSHNEREEKINKLFSVYCTRCFSRVEWREASIGFCCSKCGLVWEKPLDQWEMPEKRIEKSTKRKILSKLF